MNTLREAVQEYLALRRSLGFKLREDGARLADFATFNEVYKSFFTGSYPARTTVQVGLPPQMEIEVDCIAVIPQD